MMEVLSRGTVCVVKETCTLDVLARVESVIVRTEVSGGKIKISFGMAAVVMKTPRRATRLSCSFNCTNVSL